MTVVNDTEQDIVLSSINQETEPDFPVMVPAGSSKVIDLTEAHKGTHFSYTYNGKSYEDSVYTSDSLRYTLSVDSAGELTTCIDSGNSYHPVQEK